MAAIVKAYTEGGEFEKSVVSGRTVALAWVKVEGPRAGGRRDAALGREGAMEQGGASTRGRAKEGLARYRSKGAVQCRAVQQRKAQRGTAWCVKGRPSLLAEALVLDSTLRVVAPVPFPFDAGRQSAGLSGAATRERWFDHARNGKAPLDRS